MGRYEEAKREIYSPKTASISDLSPAQYDNIFALQDATSQLEASSIDCGHYNSGINPACGIDSAVDSTTLWSGLVGNSTDLAANLDNMGDLDNDVLGVRWDFPVNLSSIPARLPHMADDVVGELFPIPTSSAEMAGLSIEGSDEAYPLSLNATGASVLECPYPECSSKVLFTRPLDLEKHYRAHLHNYFCRITGCYQGDERTSTGFSTKRERNKHEKREHINFATIVSQYQ